MLKKLFVNMIQKYKYRKIKFKSIGERSIFKAINSSFADAQNISIGSDVWIAKGAEFDGIGGITIGNGVIMAPDVCIYSRTHNFNSIDLQAIPFDNLILTSKVVIEDYVWIGRKVMILPGVRIGKGAIVGACSVVSKDIPDYAIAVGNPAKIVKYRNKEVFDNLYYKNNSFVYTKLGHEKVYKSNTNV